MNVRLVTAFPLHMIVICFLRYAIGYAERSGPKAHIGWLASLANATDQPYAANNTGGPSIKVSLCPIFYQINSGNKFVAFVSLYTRL